MSDVRKATVTVHNPATTADLMHSWREYFCGGVVAQFLLSAPRQDRIRIGVDGCFMPFRAPGFAYGTVMLLTSTADNTCQIVFFDSAMDNGKDRPRGGFLPATTSLSAAERIRLGANRRIREQFLRELVEAAQAHLPKQTANAKTGS